MTSMGDTDGDNTRLDSERVVGPVGIFGRSLSVIEGFEASVGSSTTQTGHLGQSQSMSHLASRGSSSTVSNRGKTRSDRLKQAAATAAIFYGECYLEGVGADTADEAARESHESYRKFWLQQFGNHRHISSLGDSHNVPLFNNPNDNANGLSSQQSLPQKNDLQPLPCASSDGHTSVDVVAKSDSAQESGYFLSSIDDEYSMSPMRMSTFKKNNRHVSQPPIDCRSINKEISTDFTELFQTTYSLDNPSNTALVSDYGTDDDHQLKPSMDDSKIMIHDNDTTNTEISSNRYVHHNINTNKRKVHHDALSLVGMKNIDSDDIDSATSTQLPPQIRTAQHIENAKTSLLHSLAISDGDVTNPQFLWALSQLRTLYTMSGWDARDIYGRNLRSSSKHIEGTWMTLSRPNYYECLGKNSSGEYMYTLGRMSFDMFRPTNLVCSIQGIFNTVEPVNVTSLDGLNHVPRALKEELHRGDTALRSYNIVTAFNIEANSPQFGPYSPNNVVYRPVRGIMTTYGFVMPDPIAPNRLSIWFNRGTMEPNDNDIDTQEWKRLFGGALPKRQLQEKARLLAAKLLLGAIVPDTLNSDGSMSYFLSRPVGGHGTAYVDVLYLDDSLRVVQGSKGSIFVFARVPVNKHDL